MIIRTAHGIKTTDGDKKIVAALLEFQVDRGHTAKRPHHCFACRVGTCGVTDFGGHYCSLAWQHLSLHIFCCCLRLFSPRAQITCHRNESHHPCQVHPHSEFPDCQVNVHCEPTNLAVLIVASARAIRTRLTSTTSLTCAQAAYTPSLLVLKLLLSSDGVTYFCSRVAVPELHSDRLGQVRHAWYS